VKFWEGAGIPFCLGTDTEPALREHVAEALLSK
jgi:hypothetical protein